MNDVEQLANTLKNSGLVASMNEALNMAKEMIGTGEKVYNDFQRRSKIMTQKFEELKRQKLGINPKINQKIKLEVKEEVDPREELENKQEKENIVINQETNNEKKEVVEDNSTLNEIMQEEAKNIYEQQDDDNENKAEEKEVKENINIKEVDSSAEANVDISEMFDFTKK